MSTDTSGNQTTKTPPASLAEQIAQGLGLNNLTQQSQGLTAQNLMAQAAMGLPFNPQNYAQLTREQLGLPPSEITQRYGGDTTARDRIIREEQQGIRGPQDPEFLLAQTEVQQEKQAQQAYIDKQQSLYNQVATNPIVSTLQNQIQQASALQSVYNQQNQSAAQANLAQTQNFLNLVPSINQQQTAAAQGNLNQINALAQPAISGLSQNLSLASNTAANANANETALRNDLTDLATNGRAASPQQQALINSVYQNQLNASRQQLGADYGIAQQQLAANFDTYRKQAETDLGLATNFTTDEVAGRRGLIGTPLADSFGQLQKQYMSTMGQLGIQNASQLGQLGIQNLGQLGQLNSNLSAQAAGQSLNYPLQLGNLNVQQQYLTGQQQSRLPGAISAAATPLFQPVSYQQFLGTGYDPSSVFNNLFGLQTNAGSGVQNATNYQSPLLQSRLANTTQTSNQSVGGFIPALGAATGMLSAFGSAAQGAGGAMAGYQGVSPGCWIAEVLYGKHSPEVSLLRWYIWGPFSQTRFGKAFADAYLRYGEHLAAWLREHHWAQCMIRPIFDCLLSRAIRARLVMVVHGT